MRNEINLNRPANATPTEIPLDSPIVPIETPIVTPVIPLTTAPQRDENTSYYGMGLVFGIICLIGMGVEVAHLDFGMRFLTLAIMGGTCCVGGGYGVARDIRRDNITARAFLVGNEIVAAQVERGNQQQNDVEAGQVVTATVVTNLDPNIPSATLNPLQANRFQPQQNSLEEPLLGR